MKNDTTNTQRRKILKTAGVAGAAAGVWHKPTLNAVLTPAHAQMSPSPKMLGGSSSGSPVTSVNKSRFDQFVDSAVDTLVPTAQAGREGSGQCAAFFSLDDDYTHCIELNLPDGDDPNGAIDITLNGPDLYYDYACYYSGYYYYGSVNNLSGMASTTMSNRTFSVMIGTPGDNGVQIDGELNATLDAASGTFIYDGLTADYSNKETYSAPYYCDSSSDQGAYWSAVLDSGMCAVGTGPSLPVALDEDSFEFCPQPE